MCRCAALDTALTATCGFARPASGRPAMTQCGRWQTKPRGNVKGSLFVFSKGTKMQKFGCKFFSGMVLMQMALNCDTNLKVFFFYSIKRKLAELHRLRYVLASKVENPKLKRHFDTRPYLTLLDTSNGASRGLNFYLTLCLTPRHYIPRRDNLDSGRTRSAPPPPVGSASRGSPRSRGSKRGTATAPLSQVRLAVGGRGGVAPLLKRRRPTAKCTLYRCVSEIL